MVDTVLWIVVTALIGGGIFANWYYGDESLLMRIGGMLALVIVSVFLALQTEQGRATASLMKEARSEIRRVVWPTMPETQQTTLIVLLLVIIVALLLWVLDAGLGWIVSRVIG